MGVVCSGKDSKGKTDSKKQLPSLMRSATGHFMPISNNQIFKGEVYFSKKGDEYERIMGPMEIMGGLQSIEMFLSLENLKYDTTKKVKIKASICNNKSSDVYNFLGETEYLCGLQLNFGVTFIFDYFFEKEQILKFKVVSEEGEVISVKTVVVGHIVGKKNSVLTIPLNYKEENDCLSPMFSLTINCKNAVNIISECILELTCTIITYSQSKFTDLFIVINNINDGVNWRSVYKTKEYSGKIKEPITMDKIILKPYDLVRESKNSILFTLCIGNNQKSIGECYITLDEMREGDKIFEIEDNNNKIGELKIKYTEKPIYRFVDFLNHGLVINLVFGIDFTSSNGRPGDPHSLHYISKDGQTQYEKAIQSCGKIVGYYDNDQLFPVFGFGAELPTEDKVNFCFPLNMQRNPDIKGIDNILKYYRNALSLIELGGPTYFSPLLKKVKNRIENDKQLIYYILMILTDGNICDINETSDLIVECSLYPLSVIIVGIGNTQFNNMIKLDGDEEPLKNSKGEVTKRDIVQFVPFNKFNGDAGKLAEEVLQEIPKQIEEYFKMSNSYEKIGLKG